MSININILPQGTLAIYEQIIMQLKNAIVTGELKCGEALPSIRALAADLQVSVITTKRAYEELEKRGLSARLQEKDSMCVSIIRIILKKSSS